MATITKNVPPPVAAPPVTYDIAGLTDIELSAIESALTVAMRRWPPMAQLQEPAQGVLRVIEKARDA